MFLAEKGISLTLVSVDLAEGEQHGDAYRAINPRWVVPTLVLEDGTAIGEVLAIWRYLEEAYPATPLLGTTPKDKALVTMWERRVELEGFAAGWRAYATPRRVRKTARLPARMTMSNSGARRPEQASGREFPSDLDTRLAGAPFVAGDRFSVAGINSAGDDRLRRKGVRHINSGGAPR